MKGVIIAAGYGTRFLPATKTVPKEMFPLINRPAIDFIVEELEAAQVTELLIISSRRKKGLDDYFDREVELEYSLQDSPTKIQKIAPVQGMDVYMTRQLRMAGTADALMSVEGFVGDNPFLVAYPDDIIIGDSSLSKDMISLYKKTGAMVLGAQEIPDGDISRYGVIDCSTKNGVTYAHGLIEKPPQGTEPSRMVSFGRYLYTPDIYPILKRRKAAFSGSGEFVQTEAINELCEQGKVVVHNFKGRISDVGSPEGYIKAMLDYALSKEEFAASTREYMRKLLSE